MSTNIRFKRSDIPGKVPSLDSIDLGELALNTADGKLFTKQEVKAGAGSAAIQKIIEIGAAEVPNVLYVAKNGDDSNSGKTLGQAFLTLKKALSIATPGTTIFLKSGEYIEDNPLRVPARVSVVGDNLRNTTVRPKNPTKDIFWVYNGAYIFCMNFKGHIAPSAAVCFPPDGSAGEIVTSPYTQAVTSITTTGTGMRVDGAVTTGLRSMVCDAFTQYNQGGIGIHMLNRGNTQLVSIFTICCDISFMCENGGFCSVNLSNSSFGNYGLVSRGASEPLYRGVVKKSAGRQITFKNLAKRPNIGDGVLFADYNQRTCDRDNGLVVDGLAFDLLYEGTTQSTFAGLRYWKKDNLQTPVDQLAPTVAAIKRAQTVAKGVIAGTASTITGQVLPAALGVNAGNTTAQRLATEAFGVIAGIVENGPTSPSLIVGPDLDAAEPEYKTLRETVLDRQSQIVDQTIDFLTKNYPNLPYVKSKCMRDLSLVISAIADDMIFGTNYKTIKAALSYLSSTASTGYTIPSNQSDATREAFKFARDKIVPIVQEDATLLARVQANFTIIDQTLVQGASYITGITSYNSNDTNKLVYPNVQDTDLTVADLVKNLQANKEFIKAEVNDYIKKNWPTVVAYGYNQDTCKRDIGFALDAICYDILYGGNSQTLDAAKRYFNYASGLTELRSSEEVPATVDAFGRVQLLSQRVVILDPIQKQQVPVNQTINGLTATTQTQVNRLGGLFSLFLKQLETDIVATSDFIQPNGSRTDDNNLENSYKLLQANKAAMKTDVINYLSRAYPAFDYDKVKCARDVGYIVDSVCFDLVHGGNRQSVQAGIYYYDFNEESNVLKSVLPKQIKQTVNAYKYMKELLRDVLTCSPTPNPWQGTVPQRIDLPAATGSEVVAVGNLIDIINEILVEGPNNSEDSIQRIKQPIGLTASGDINKQRAFNLLMANRQFIQAEMLAYINQNWFVISEGDTSFARVNTATELTLGTTTTGYPTVTYQPASLKAIRDAVLAAKEEIKAETIKFMANSFFDNFSFNKPKCYRDVGLILDAILSDMVFDSNYKTITAAISYLRAYASEVIGAQKVQTIAALKAAKSITLARIVTPAAKTEISTRFDIILDILEKETGDGYTLTFPIPTRNSEEDIDRYTAVNILRDNVDFIKKEIVAYIDANFTLNEFDREKCSRDTGLIIDALGYDLMFISNFRSISAGRAYLRANAKTVTGSQKLATLGAFRHLKKLAVAAVKSNSLAVNSIQSNMDIILDILDKGEEAVPKFMIPFPETGRSIEFKRARDLVQKNREFIVDEVLTYVNTPGLELIRGTVTHQVNSISGQFLTNGSFYQEVSASSSLNTLTAGDLVRISGNLFGTSTIGGYTNPSTYKVSVATTGSAPGILWQKFTLVNLDGTALVTTPGSTGKTTSMRFEVIKTGTYAVPAGFDLDKCRRDLNLILDAVYYDTTYGGTLESVAAAQSYFVGAVSQLNASGNAADEIDATIRAYELLRTVIKEVAEDNVWVPTVGNTSSQVRSPNGSDGSEEAAREMGTCIDFILNVLRDDSTIEVNLDTQATLPDISWVDSAARAAHDALQAVRFDTQEAVSDYVDENYVLFGYDRAKCARDVGNVIEAVRYDMMFNSNFRSIVAGRSYYRAMASTVVKDQKPATLASFQYLKEKLLEIVKAVDPDNPTADESASIQRVSRSMDTILDILENGLTAEPAFIRPDPTGTGGLVPNVFDVADRATLRNNIETNRNAIEDDLITWIDNEISTNAAYSGVTYNKTACRRDVEYILDALYYDLTYGGNLETRVAAQAYYAATGDNIPLALGSDEVALTLAAYNQLKTIIDGITAVSTTPSDTLIEFIRSYISTGTLGGATAPEIGWVSLSIRAFNTKLSEASVVSRLKQQVTDFVDLNFAYNKDKCARDVGFLIDALCYDLLYGGNVETTQAAVAYFNGAVTPKSTIPKQIIQTVAAYERMKDVLANVVQLKDVLPSTDSFTAKQRFESNMDLILNIVENGEQFAPARPYLMPLPTTATGVTNNASVAGYLNARNNISANREFIKAETIDYIDSQVTPPNYNKVKCERDIDLILDALLYDLTYGGNTATRIASAAYYDASQTLGTGEVAATTGAYTAMANIIESVALGQLIATTNQNRVVQVVGTGTGVNASGAHTTAKNLVLQIIVRTVDVKDSTALVNGTSYTIVALGAGVDWNSAGAGLTPAVGQVFTATGATTVGTGGKAIVTIQAASAPSTAWVATTLTDINALIDANWIQSVKDKVNLIFNPVAPGAVNKFPAINYTGTLKSNCEADIDDVIAAVRFDMMFGSNFRSQVAGRAYFRAVTGAQNVLATQKDASLAVYQLVKDQLADLVATAVPEQVKTGKAGNAAAASAAGSLVQDIINFIDNTVNDPTETEPTIANGLLTWVDPDLVVLSTTLADSKTGANSVANVPASITTYINDRFPELTYSVNDCQEDIRSITDAVRYDMMFGGNFRTISAARAYFRAVAAKAVGVQKTATVESFRLLKEKLTDLVKTNALALDRVTASMDLLIRIVDKGVKAIPQFVVPSPSNYNGTFLSTYGYARNLIETNRDFLKNEVLKYITVTYPTLDFKEDKCLQDLDFILDAIYYDMTYGGNMETIIAGGAYYRGIRATDLVYGTLSGVAITGTAGQFSCTSTTLKAGDAVTITGTLGGTGTITGYVTGNVYKISATNGSTTFTLVNLDNTAIVTTAGTPTGLTYTQGQVPTITGDDVAATIGAYGYLKTLIEKVAQGQDVSQLQISIPQVGGEPGSIGGAQTAKNLAYVIRNLINSTGTYAVAAPTFVAPNVSWVELELKTPNDLIELYKTSDAGSGGYLGRNSVPSKLTQWITIQQELADPTSPTASTTVLTGPLAGTVVNRVGAYTDWYKIVAGNPVVVNATSLTIGKKYKVLTVGGSAFTSVGAANNNVGVVFTATGQSAGGTGTVHEMFTYNVDKCERDIALVMDAVRYDMMFGTNFRTRTAAISYWRQQANSALNTGSTTNSTYPQKEVSRLMFTYMKTLLQSLPTTVPKLTNPATPAIPGIANPSTAHTRIGALMDDIIGVFDSGVTTFAQAAATLPAKPYSLPLPAGGTNNSRDPGYRAARDLIEQNRDFIKAEVLSWIDQQKRENRDGFVTPFNFNRTECAQDLDLILDAVYYDMTYGGNMESYTAGLAYYNGVTGVGASLPADEREATIRAYNYMGQLLFNVARSIKNKSYQLAIEQVKGTSGSAETAKKLGELVDIVINVVKGGTKQLPPKVDPEFLAGDETLAYVRIAVQEQKFELQARIADYIDAFILQYNTEKCARDVGLILDAAMYDLVLNSNFQSITAGSVYLQKAANVVTSTQIGPQLQAIKFIRDQVIALSQKPPLVKNEQAIGRITNLFDTMFDIIDKGVEVAPDIVNVPPQGAAFNQFAINAANSIIANKEFLKEEVVAYITANYKTYDQSRCSRDVGLIIDAVLYDLLLDTNYNSVKAGISYRRATSSLVVTDQLKETLGGIDFAKKKVVDLLDDANAIASVTRSFELISSIIGGGSVPTTSIPSPGGSVYALPRPSGILVRDKSFQVAAAKLLDGTEQTAIKGAVETWILSQISGASAGSIWYGFTYTGTRKTKCEEDIGFILNAIAYDLTYGGNMETMSAGRAYYAGLANASLTNAAEIPTTIATYTYLSELIKTRLALVTGVTAQVRTEAENLVLEVRNLVNSAANNVAGVRLPDQTWADPLTQEISAFLVDDKPRLQDVIIDYVNNIATYTGSAVTTPANYDQDKCRRDVGLVLDAVRYDLMFGTNFRTISAGRSYRRSFANVITGATQNQANINSFIELKERVLGKKLTGVTRGAGNGEFVCNNPTTIDTTPLFVGQSVRVSGVYGVGNTLTLANYANLASQPKTYYVIATNGTTTFTLSETVGGTAIVTGGTAGAAPLGLTFEIRSSIEPLDTVITQGLLDTVTLTASNAAQPLVVGREYKIKSIGTQTVAAGGFIVGARYKIVAINSTNFQNCGATSNTVGLEFTATNSGTGTGTATFVTDYTLYGASNNKVGTVFRATQTPIAVTTLTAGAADNATTLTVADTTNFPSAGSFIVEGEAISYTGKTATTFTGCTRSLTAVALNNGATVTSLTAGTGQVDTISIRESAERLFDLFLAILENENNKTATVASADGSSDVFTTSANHTFVVGDAVEFTTNASTYGLVEKTTYYVRTVTPNTFTLSETLNGTTFDIPGVVTITANMPMSKFTKIEQLGYIHSSDFNTPAKQGGSGTFYNITPPSAGTGNAFTAAIKTARDNINAARQSLEDDLITWIEAEAAATNGNFNSTFATDWAFNSYEKRDKCRKDIKLILDAIAYDLTFGGNQETIVAGKAYYDGTALDDERLATIDAYTKLKGLITTVAGANGGNTGLVETLIDDLITYIDQNSSDPIEVAADTSWVDSELYVFSDKLKAEANNVAVSTTTYINANYPGLVYNVATCQRDVRLIIEAVRWDMMFNSNFRTVTAARSYYRAQAATVVGAQQTATIDAFKVVKVTLDEFVKSDKVAQTRVAALMDIVINTLTTGLAALPAVSLPYGGTPNATDIGFLNARDRIEENRHFILEDMRSYLLSTVANGGLGLTSGTSFAGAFTTTECLRDVGLILDAVRYDLTYGGNMESVAAGRAYYAGSVLLGNTSATIDVTTNASGVVTAVAVNSGGTGYTVSSNITLELNGPGSPTTKATVTATTNALGVVTGVTLVQGGAGYTASQTAVSSATRSLEHVAVTESAYTRLATVLEAVAKNTAHTTISAGGAAYAGPAQVTANTAGSTEAAAQAKALVDVIKSYVGTSSGNDAAEVRPSTSWVDNNLSLIASTMLDRRAESLPLQVTDYIDAQFPGFAYNKDTCKRDVQYVVDAVRFDMMFGTNFRSWTAGKAYYRNMTSALVVTTTQKAATLASFRYLKTLLVEIAGNNVTAVNRVKGAMNVVIDTLEQGETTRNANNPKIAAAVDAITANKEALLTSMGAWLDTNVTNNFGGYYNKDTCIRDLRYLIDAIRYDLTYGGNMESVVAGLAYYEGVTLRGGGGAGSTSADHVDKTQAAFTQLGTLIKALSGVDQYAVDPLVDTLIANVNALIDDDASVAQVYADASWAEVGLQEAAVAVRAQTNTIKTQVTNYINTNFPTLVYNQATCQRDVGLVIDAVRWDMLFNSNFRSITAGRSYWRSIAKQGLSAVTTPGQTANQKAASVAAFTYLKDVLLATAAGNVLAQERITTNMDIILQILESGLGDQANPTITYPTVAAPTNASKAKDILLANRAFIQEEIVKYINNNFNAVFYDEEKCARDVELITTAIAYDMVQDGNFNTIRAAQGYLRANASNVLTDQQKHITILAMKYLKNLLTNYVGGNATAKTRVKALIEIVIDTINKGAVSASTTIDYGDAPTPAKWTATNIAGNYDTTGSVVKAIVDNVITYIETSVPAESYVGLVPTTGYDATKCKRDLQFILEGLRYDLTHGGNWATVVSARSYYVGVVNQLGGDATEIAATLRAYEYLKTQANLLANISGDVNTGTVNTTTAVSAASRVATLIEIIRTVISGGESAIPAIEYPELLGSDNELEAARNVLISNVANAKAKVIRYTNDRAYFVYDSIKCERDIGYILDAVFIDIVTNSNYLSVTAGNSYLRSSANNAIAAPQKWAILAGLTHAKSVLTNLVSTNTEIVSFIRSKLSVVIDIINDGLVEGGVPPTQIENPYVSLSFPSNKVTSNTNNTLQLNRGTIITALDTWLTNTYDSGTGGAGGFWSNLSSLKQNKCKRDTGFILDALTHDLTYGGNVGTRTVAAAYFVGAVNYLDADSNNPEEITATLAAYERLKTEIATYVPTQEATANALIDNIKAVVQNGLGSLPAEVLPTLAGASAAALAARTTLLNAKEHSTYKILDHINSRPYLSYNSAKCQRDVEIILDALRFDEAKSSNFKSIKAGQAYLRSYSKTVTQEQKQATIGALYFVKKQVSAALSAAGVAVVDNQDVRSLMDVIIDILDRGEVAIPEAVITATADTDAAMATATIVNNKDFIKAEVRAWIEINYPELDYNKIKCERDVAYILDALRYDLAFGGNSETIEAGLSYWEGNALTLGTGTTVTSTLVTAGNFVIGQKYQIATLSSGNSPSNTDFTTIGASSSTVGVVFTATGNGESNGNGQAYLVVGVEEEKLATVGAYAFLADLVKALLDNNYSVQQQSVISKGTYVTSNTAGVSAADLSTTAKTLITNIKNIVNSASKAAADTLANTTIGVTLPAITGTISSTIVTAKGTLPNLTTAEINKAFINNSTGAFVAGGTNYKAGTAGNVQFFVYNQAKCSRDIGFVVDALAFDAFFGGNKETREAALQYAYKGGLVIPEATKVPTVGGFTRLVDIIDKIVDGTAITKTTGVSASQDQTNPSSADFGDAVAAKAQVVIDVLNGNSAPVLVEPDAIANKTADPEYLVIRELVKDSVPTIAAQTITFINETYAGFGYLQDTCKRDVGLSLDAIAYDLIYGGNSRTKFAAEQYYSGGRFQIPADSKSATVACFVYLDALIRKVIKNEAIVTFQNYVDQDKSNQQATDSEVSNVASLMDAYTDILTNGYISVLQLDATFNGSVDDNTYATFHQVSTITTTGHTLEWVGTGIDVDSALPYNGGVPKPENQLVSDKGGFINFTSTDEKGDFRIGPDLTIKRDSGSIVGRAFNKSLLGVITPYILALQG